MNTEELLKLKERIKSEMNSDEILKASLPEKDYKLYSPASKVQELQKQLKIVEDRINTTNIEIRGGKGNKVIYSYDVGYSKGKIEDKESTSTYSNLRELRDYKFTKYLEDNRKDIDIKAYTDVYGRSSKVFDLLNKYKVKLKHRLILIIMSYINSESMLDKLSNIIYTDRKLELVEE